MNDSTLKNLKIVVERAVRPVRATTTRKRRMREELLAHLSAVSEEEVEKLGDEQAALDEARRRFGDPRELSDQLQQTVPRCDRLRVIGERLFEWQPGESLWHFAGKQLLAMLVVYVVATLMIGLPSLVVRGRQAEIPIVLHIVLVQIVFTPLVPIAFLFLPYRIGRLLYGDEAERSLRKVAWYSLGSLAVLPALAFGSYWAGTFDLASSLIHLRLGCLFAPAVPVFAIIMARPMFDEMRYKEEWANLEIDS